MKFLLRVVFKALLLFAVVNVLMVGLATPGGRLYTPGYFSLYNHLFEGRPRFPFGETPREAYSFSLFNLEAMFESHIIDVDKPSGEFRVLVLGDSSVWGTLLRPAETLAGQLDALNLSAPDGRRMRFYNLGYPTLSLTKDLMILEESLYADAPDMVIWLTTLEAFPRDKQLSVPLVANNPARAQDLIRDYRLNLDPNAVPKPSFWEKTLIGQRKNLADLARLQLYGVLWTATGIDQLYPADYPRAQVDMEADPTYYGQAQLSRDGLAFEVLQAGADRLAEENIPLLLVNEPIMISTGANSDMRYNFYYPRAAYDQYRAWMAEAAGQSTYTYLDAWDLIPMEDFTNSAIHINARATALLAEEIRQALPVQGAPRAGR